MLRESYKYGKGRLQNHEVLQQSLQEETQLESKDIEYEFLDIGNEMMSASFFWDFARYTGTRRDASESLFHRF